jgi:hydroxymethylbilane synthase
MGTGIFTKALDDALLAGQVDLTVHSMKDVPTQLLDPMEAWAVLERGMPGDVLVGHNPSATVVATGSIRRKAQWLHRHPDHTAVGLRGNVETRLAKVKSNPWRGGVFAAAGLDRLGMLEDLEQVEHLEWMVPAPAQGSILVVGRKGHDDLKRVVAQLDHPDSSMAASIERAFLSALEGGCAAPIGAFAQVKSNHVTFTGCLHSLDGKDELRIDRNSEEAHSDLGATWAEELLSSGGQAIMEAIRKHTEGHG